MSHIVDQVRAARRDAERDWPGDDRPTRAEANADAALHMDPVDCGACGECLACSVVWVPTWDGRAR